MNCYRHPDRPARATCVSCGNFICDICDVSVGGKHYCKPCLERTAPAPTVMAGPEPFAARRLTRNRHDRMVAGVCGGMARHFGMDPTVVRVIAAVAGLFTAIAPFVIVYIILVLVVPVDERY